MDDESEAAGLVRRAGYLLADLGLHLLLFLIVLAVTALPAVVVWAFVDSDAAAKVWGVTIGICVGAASLIFLYSIGVRGDY